MTEPVLIATIATISVVIFYITTYVQILVAVIIGRTTGAFVSALAGSFTAWAVIDWLWLRFEGGHPTLAALGAAMLVITLRHLLSSAEAREKNRWLAVTELLTIILLAGYTVYISKAIRWY